MSFEATYREYPPSPALRGFVACYWTRTAVRDGATRRAHRVLPDGAIDIVFDLAETRVTQASQVVGTMTLPLVLGAVRVDDYLGVRFQPGRAAAFLRVDAAELTDRRVDLADVWSRPGRTMGERLVEAQGVTARLRVLDRVLLDRLARVGPTDPYVDAVIDEAVRLRGAIDLREMERRTGVSGAWLRRGFRRHVGVGPKFFCRVVRLQGVLARVRAEGRPSWATLAADQEFADQAHLVREFTALVGLSPTRFHSEDRFLP